MNKLGINEYKLNDIEKQIIKLKLDLIDYYFTFNNEQLDFKFLNDLHEFLFGDFYFDSQLGTRKIEIPEEELIEEILIKLNYLCLGGEKNIEEILSLLKELWKMQPFILGNTRTLVAFLKIINNIYLLGLEIDSDIKIKSCPKMFELNNFVNQKRLTKQKNFVNII